jgi:NADH oxidase (H2O2-forming)
MKKTDVLVVGGSAAGLTAAITARRHNPDKGIMVIRSEDKVLVPCGIPYIFGTVGAPDKNLIPDGPYEQNKIDLFIDEVSQIDRENKKVKTKGGEDVQYDRMIIATGSLPMMPPIPGFEKENVFPVHKNIPHLLNMQKVLKKAKKLVIIGGGFIGVEFADECKKIDGLDVSIVELLPHCLQLAFDPEFCEDAEKVLADHGINLLLEEKVASIEGKGKVEGVKLASGKTMEADVVIVGIGAVANANLAKEADLKIGPTGAIVVDRFMKTSDENIFACGDCAEKVSFFGGRPSPLRLASIACAEARIAGANLYGNKREYIGTIGVFSTAIGDMAMAVAGLTESNARRQGYDVIIGVSEAPNRHPGGMPGMKPLKVKLMFERRTWVLLGAEMRGDKAAGELVNAASSCIQHKMTTDDIASFQMGTHPALTASPIAYQFVNAAEAALLSLK